MTQEDYRFDGALTIFLDLRKHQNWVIAEAIADRTRTSYEACLKHVRELRRLPHGMPTMQMLEELEKG